LGPLDPDPSILGTGPDSDPVPDPELKVSHTGNEKDKKVKNH
jgi:hypothetical protein